MPVPFLKSLSKETGKSINELEKLWGKAKKLASEHFNKPESEFGDSEFAYVAGIVKKMARKEENIEVLTVTEDTKIPGTRFTIKKGQKFEFSIVDEAASSLENVQAQVVKLFKSVNGLYVKDTKLEIKKHSWGPDSKLSIEVEWDYGVDLKKLEPSINAICKRFPEVHWDYYDFPDFPTRWYYFYESSTQECIEITKECSIPGTGIVLEEGDKIQLVESVDRRIGVYRISDKEQNPNEERIKELRGFIHDLYMANRDVILEVKRAKLNTVKEIQSYIEAFEAMIRNLNEIKEYEDEIWDLERK